MDELSPIAREALRRYHTAAGLDPAARARVWRDIDASLACEPPRAAPVRRLVAASLLTALAAALVFAVCDVRGRLGETRRADSGAAVYEVSPATDRPAEPRVPAAIEAAPPVVAPPVVAPPLVAPPLAAPGPALRPSRPPEGGSAGASDGAPAAEPDLAAEVALMRQARAALDRGDPDAALRVLAEHAQDFAAGQMKEDRLRLRIEALCALGRRDRARAEADAFLRDHPGSTHTARVRGLCRDGEDP